MESLIRHLRAHQRAYLLPIWAVAAVLYLVGAISLGVAIALALGLSLAQVLLAEQKRAARR